MPLLQISAGPDGPELYGAPRPLGPALAEGLQHPGPVIVMIHGFKFAPGDAFDCPHRHILSLDPARDCWKAMSWPRALGFGSGFEDEGLGLAFGWPARGTIWQAYDRAEKAGRALATLIRQVRRAAPGRRVHLLTHSLGARVALSALPHLAEGDVGRAILLNPAEFGGRARAALATPAGCAAEVFNVTSRENDFFDFLLERLIAPPHRGDGTLAQTMPRQPNTLTLQLDHPGTLRALNAHGFPVAPPSGRICHWSSYLRPGVFSLYRTLLRHPEALSQARLRSILPDRPDPRWSRVLQLPDWRVPLPVRRNASL
ncbi:alpha/beta hydrolase [Roseovarius sp.]|uniref:alpha/beta hydrolase n=1 Tax=Roseovarius sp. TaxID=1486281 RepID=UPI003BAA25F7